MRSRNLIMPSYRNDTPLLPWYIADAWEKIIRRLDMQTAKNFRLVSKKTKSLVDTYYNKWEIKIDLRTVRGHKDLHHALNFLADLQVSTVNLKLSAEENLVFQGFSKRFRDSNTFKLLRIIGKSKKKCTAKYAELMYETSLVSLDLTVSFERSIEKYPKGSLTFPNLERLGICILFPEEPPYKGPLDPIVHQIVEEGVFPKLKTLDITMKLPFGEKGSFLEEKKIRIYFLGVVCLTMFIKRQGPRLENFSFSSGKDFALDLPFFLQFPPWQSFEPISNLKSVRIQSNVFEPMWINMVEAQTKLVHLKVSDILVGSVFVKKVVDRNCSTLESIEMGNLGGEWVGGVTFGIDFGLFSPCHTLKRLALTASPMFLEQSRVLVGRNRDRLPASLTEIVLERIESE